MTNAEYVHFNGNDKFVVAVFRRAEQPKGGLRLLLSNSWPYWMDPLL